MTSKPCTCPLCREPMRNLPHGTRSWHCSICGETITEGYLLAWLEAQQPVSVAIVPQPMSARLFPEPGHG